jgi:hypothetical protein
VKRSTMIGLAVPAAIGGALLLREGYKANHPAPGAPPDILGPAFNQREELAGAALLGLAALLLFGGGR